MSLYIVQVRDLLRPLGYLRRGKLVSRARATVYSSPSAAKLSASRRWRYYRILPYRSKP